MFYEKLRSIELEWCWNLLETLQKHVSKQLWQSQTNESVSERVCVSLERQRWGDTANNSWRNAALFTRGSHLKAAVICWSGPSLWYVIFSSFLRPRASLERRSLCLLHAVHISHCLLTLLHYSFAAAQNHSACIHLNYVPDIWKVLNDLTSPNV